VPSRWYAWAEGEPEPTVAAALSAAAVLQPGVVDVEKAADLVFHRRHGGAPILLQHVPAPGSEWRHRLSPADAAEAFRRACERDPEGRRGRTSAGVALPVTLAASRRFPADWLAWFFGTLMSFHRGGTQDAPLRWPRRLRSGRLPPRELGILE
jgi:hypothetical protein